MVNLKKEKAVSSALSAASKRNRPRLSRVSDALAEGDIYEEALSPAVPEVDAWCKDLAASNSLGFERAIRNAVDHCVARSVELGVVSPWAWIFIQFVLRPFLRRVIEDKFWNMFSQRSQKTWEPAGRSE